MEKVRTGLRGALIIASAAIVVMSGLSMPGLLAESNHASATLFDATGAEVGP